MPEFIMDTSGDVDCARKWQTEQVRDGFKGVMRWSDLPEGVRGYLEAAFFTDADNPDTDGHASYCENHCAPSFGDLAPESLAQAVADWEAFSTAARELLEAAYQREGYSEIQAGRDFWYTRNGHGVGFWDRDALEPDDAEYERLTAELVAASKSGDNEAWNRICAARSALRDESLGAKLTAACEPFPERYVTLEPEAGRVVIE